MQYRRLGGSGLLVSTLSLGAWVTYGVQVGEDMTYDCMKAAFDRGCNFFDNAEAYGMGRAETVMGAALQRLGWSRAEYVVSTKIFWAGEKPNQTGLSRKHIVEGTEAALRRLRLDYVDLIFCHRPDIHTPLEETVRAMNHVIQQGKALYWGTSEWSARELSEAHAIARREHLIPPQMEQPQYHMFHRERVEKEYAPLYASIGLGTTTWSPLASGLLTGKYRDGIPDGSRLSLRDMGWLKERLLGDEGRRRIAKVEELRPIAAGLGCSLAQLALAWCTKNPHVSTVITGASRVEQVDENFGALAVAERMDASVIDAIEGVLGNRPEPETDWRDN